MNFKTTILLLALLIIVGAVWLFFPKRRSTRGARLHRRRSAPTNRNPSSTRRPRTINSCASRSRGPASRAWCSSASRRKCPAPMTGAWSSRSRLPADGNKLVGLIRTLTGLQAKPAVPEGSKSTLSAADAGLEPPAMTLTLADKEGKQYKLEIGRKAAMSNDTYLRVAGQPTIQLTMRDLRPQFDKDAKDFRALRLRQLQARRSRPPAHRLRGQDVRVFQEPGRRVDHRRAAKGVCRPHEDTEQAVDAAEHAPGGRVPARFARVAGDLRAG